MYCYLLNLTPQEVQGALIAVSKSEIACKQVKVNYHALSGVTVVWCGR
jgi:hypothetical protein